MRRSLRPWWLALGASVLLHISLFGGLDWTIPQWKSPLPSLPLEVQLAAESKPAPTPVLVLQPRPPVEHPALPLRPMPEATELSDPPDPPVAATIAPDITAEAVENVVAARAEEVSAVVPVLVEDVPPPLNALPPRLKLHFQVRYGLASGEQTLQWVNEGERYTLVSVAEATGLAGVFYRGRFVQTSRGRITPYGLQPEEFWDQRGDKHSRAHFNPEQGQLTFMPTKGAPRHFAYQGEVQDALSLFFQLALTAPPPDGPLSYRVFNGKKLRDYTYEMHGEQVLETALGVLRTLHLARVADGDGRFEIWLAIDHFYLPVRVLRSDDNGSEVELELQSITP
jgi:hypothetical protein